MYKVESILIVGFWQSKKKASSRFKEDVNIIIGKNGTGKTTFMNILHAVLAVDIDALYDNFFDSVEIKLVNGKRKRTIRANRSDDTERPFPIVEYYISTRRYVFPLIGTDEGRLTSPTMRRRAAEAAQQIKVELSKLVSVTSLSVYRISGDTDPETRERFTRRVPSSPVDMRLTSLKQQLTQYQLELSNNARSISSELQRSVLTSLLFTGEQPQKSKYPKKFDEANERQKLTSAYKQLGVSGTEISKKIKEHISAVATAFSHLKEFQSSKKSDVFNPSDFSALEAFSQTSTVVEMSLQAETKTKAIFSQIDLFITTLRSFIPDKTFQFDGGELVVVSEGPIPLAKLSSGEKQLLILFIEALLQRQEPYIFLADEPELSLHISWQRNIIAAIKSLNPNAQIIVATHSPEIAGKFRDRILDMEDILRG